MIKRLTLLLLLVCSTANAQFVTGQILTAQQLNNAFANVLALTGGTLSGPLAVPTMTVTGNLTVNGTFTLNGGLLPGSLAPQAANTALANVTSSTASPAAVALPSCSTANSALKYTSGTGWFCGTTYALTTGTLAQFAATTSAQLAGVISDETGSGALVFGTNPTVSGATISGGTISNTPISGNTGAFTTLSASSTVSGAGFTSLLSPYAPLASPTFTGTVTIPGGASISGYLTTASAASTYAPLASPALTGTPTAPTASAGTNTAQLATTAFANTIFAAPPCYGCTTAAAVHATTINASSTITPSSTSGIVGTTTNDNANAGSVGEYLTNNATGVSMTTATATVCASISLTAGDWDVNGTVNYSPAGTTTVSSLYAGTSTGTAITTGNNGQFQVLVLPFQTGQQQLIVAPLMRWSLASTTTINLIGYSVFGTSTMTCGGFIRARRIR